MHDHVWKYCDSELKDILKDTKPWSAPLELNEGGFILHDKLVGSYYEEQLKDQYWTVIIRDDGKFEIIDEKKNYEDGTVTLWSKNGYEVCDEDGYVNMRSAPNSSSDIIVRLNNETKLDILDASSDWWKVAINGMKGYIHRSRIRKV